MLIEHKSSKDKYVHYQLLSYMASIYKQYKKEGYVVIPVVLYHGKSRSWDVPLSFHNQLGLKEYPSWLHSFLEKHVLNFQYMLLNLHNLDVCRLIGKLTVAFKIFVFDKRTLAKRLGYRPKVELGVHLLKKLPNVQGVLYNTSKTA